MKDADVVERFSSVAVRSLLDPLGMIIVRGAIGDNSSVFGRCDTYRGLEARAEAIRLNFGCEIESTWMREGFDRRLASRRSESLPDDRGTA